MCHSLINKKFVIVGIFLGNRRIKHFGKCCYLENKLFCSANKSLNHSVDHFPNNNKPWCVYSLHIIHVLCTIDLFAICEGCVLMELICKS